jgi:hypothetical protein
MEYVRQRSRAFQQADLDLLGAKEDFNPQGLNPTSTQRLLTAVAAIQRRLAVEALAI